MKRKLHYMLHVVFCYLSIIPHMPGWKWFSWQAGRFKSLYEGMDPKEYQEIYGKGY